MRATLIVPVVISSLLVLACGGAGSSTVTSPERGGEVAADVLAQVPAPHVPAAASVLAPPSDMKKNLHVSNNLEVFPTLVGDAPPTIREGDHLFALGLLDGTTEELAGAKGKSEARFVLVLGEGGAELARHEWTWKASHIDMDGKAFMVNVVPSYDAGRPDEDWTAAFALAMGGLADGEHDLTLQLQSPDGDPQVMAWTTFAYQAGGGSDYGILAKDLDDHLHKRGKYAKAARPSAAGGGGISNAINNNCKHNAALVLTEPSGKKQRVTIPATQTKTVWAPKGTEVSSKSAQDGSKLNQRLRSIDKDGWTVKLCN
ncbi:MAG: hypothetical protein ACI9MC_003104 [Kiritimatiellia bacterium]|jgi:hypothetical protein